MKAGLIGFAVFAACLVQAADLRDELSMRDKAITHAMLKKDYKTLEKLMRAGMAPNFVYIEGGQKQNIDQMLSNMKMGLGSMKKLSKVMAKPGAVNQKGNTATVETRHYMEGLTAGADNKDHTLVFDGISVDTYAKIGGKWKMTKMVWKSQKMTMDGKPVSG